MKRLREGALAFALTAPVIACSLALPGGASVAQAEFDRRYRDLRAEVETRLNAQQGDRRISLQRNLTPKERAALRPFVPEDCPVQVDQLVALDVRFRRLDGTDGFGRLVVSQYFSQKAISDLGGVRSDYVKRLRADPQKRDIASELSEFFVRNYRSADPYPIEHLIPLEYFFDVARSRTVSLDAASMEFNNSYAFAARKVRDSSKWSRHASGAWDVNPAYNPIILPTDKEGAQGLDMNALDSRQLLLGVIEVQPKVAIPYAFDRQRNHHPYVLREDSQVTAYFLESDWSWGGKWRSLKDYQHFSPGIE